jgi:hypothetical protein
MDKNKSTLANLEAAVPNAESSAPPDRNSLVKDRDMRDYGAIPQDSSDTTQAGVKTIEAISSNWTKAGLIVAYVS